MKDNVDAAIVALAESNTFSRGLHEQMPPTSDKVYNDIYNKVRTFTEKEIITVARQSMTTRGASTAHKSPNQNDTES